MRKYPGLCIAEYNSFQSSPVNLYEAAAAERESGIAWLKFDVCNMAGEDGIGINIVILINNPEPYN